MAGRYAFEAELGRGGSARVIRVRDVHSDHVCVAKVVPASSAASLAVELDALREVQHPGIVRPHELLRLTSPLPAPYLLAAGAAVLVEALVEGAPLATRPPCGTWEELAALGEALALALDELHRVNLVHGDVSPNNVLITAEGPVLIDLGHAGSPQIRGSGAAGTLAFMSPEAFAGARTPAADLFALARTLLTVAPGAPAPSPAALTLAEAHELSLRAGTGLAQRLGDAPTALLDTLTSLLAPDSATRPDDAAEVARRFARVCGSRSAEQLGEEALAPSRVRGRRSRERLAGVLRALPFAGHEAQLADAMEHLRARSLRGLAATLVEVEGPPGSGRERFAQELAQRLQRLAFDAGWTVPTITYADELPAPPTHPSVVLVSEPGLDAARALRFLEASEIERAPCIIVVSRELGPRAREAWADDARVMTLRLGPVSAASVRALLARALRESLDDHQVDAALGLTGGLVGALVDLLATHALDGTLSHARDLTRLAPRKQGHAHPALPVATLELIEQASLCPSGLPLDASAPEGLAAALTLGLLVLSSAGHLVVRADVREAVLAAMPATRRTRLAASLLVRVSDPLARGQLAVIAGDVERAENELRRAIGQSLTRAAAAEPASVPPQRVFELAELIPGLSAGARRAAAEWLRRRAEPQLALALLGEVADLDDTLLAAEIRRQRGDAEGARVLLERLEARVTDTDTLAGHEGYLRAAGRLALDLRRRRGVDATSSTDDLGATKSVDELLRAFAAARPERHEESPAFLELRALRAFMEGDTERADADAETACAILLRRGEPGEAARCASVRATLAQRRGDAAGAYSHGRQAFELAEGAMERLAAAVYGLNLGLACFELGRLGEALTRVRAGAEQLAELGSDALMAQATLNLAHIHIAYGDDDAASELLPLAERAAARAPHAGVQAHAQLTWADIELRRGKRQGSVARVEEAFATLGTCAAEARPLLLARAALGLAEAGSSARAEEVLRDPQLRESEANADTQLYVSLAQGTLALDPPRAERPGSDVDAARRDAIARLEAIARDPRAWERQLRATLLRAELLERVGDTSAARSALQRARSLLDVALHALPSLARPQLLQAVRYQAALRVAPLDEAAAERARGSDGGAFRELPAWMQRFIQAGHPTRLMQRVADAAQALTRAERGFLVERDPSGAWLTLAATEDSPGPALAFSRSVASRALATGRAVSALDAIDDVQLSASSSVLGIGTRSVMAAPLRCPERELVLYVDDRLRPAAFDDESADVFAACAALAGLALSASLDASALRAKQEALAKAEAELRVHADAQQAELDTLRRALATSDYGGIIAGPGPMRHTLELAQRAATSSVPVLILGESGTGKELVARFLHDHSERRAQRFISENCAAIPDTLLESALFGHERGAFTGAERARQGLFQAADGGTLFLDEIGEMSPAMQSKLLRVLQNGEVRPVGGSRSSRVDVRLVTATHRDLRAMVSAGTFREDLYYRVTVVTLELPPLRERRSDIPLLVRHFLGKHERGQTRRIAPEAMRRLTDAPWPGNVRQLENEVQRLLVMAGDPVEVRDVASSGLGAAAGAGAHGAHGAGAPAEGSLALREHVDALERTLITAALERTEQNQTRAALELGISRFGLQKMMKRLGLR